eukprot:1886978-Lingulodinium_polyedra.AAC.1
MGQVVCCGCEWHGLGHDGGGVANEMWSCLFPTLGTLKSTVYNQTQLQSLTIPAAPRFFPVVFVLAFA